MHDKCMIGVVPINKQKLIGGYKKIEASVILTNK